MKPSRPRLSQSVSMLRPITDFDSRISLTGLKRGIWARMRTARIGLRRSPACISDAPKQTSRPPGRRSAKLCLKLRPPSASKARSNGLFLAGDPAYLVDHVVGAVVDGLVDAEAADRVVLRGRGRAPDLGSRELRDLSGGDADAPAGGLDQHALARAQAAVVDQPGVCGCVRDRQRRRLGVAPAVRDRDQRVAARHGELGVAAEARPAHDPLADLEVLDSLADGVDVAGDLVADDAGRLRGVRVEPDAREQVGEVDAGGAHAHADLARAGLRIGTLLYPHDVGRAVLGDDERSHTRIIPTRARSASSAPVRAEPPSPRHTAPRRPARAPARRPPDRSPRGWGSRVPRPAGVASPSASPRSSVAGAAVPPTAKSARRRQGGLPAHARYGRGRDAARACEDAIGCSDPCPASALPTTKNPGDQALRARPVAD